MRIILTISIMLQVFLSNLSAQSDFKTLDSRTYNYYIQGDYRNLKKTADSIFAQGIDYYYLNMRLGILAFNNQRYSNAISYFTRAIEFSSLDTISREYIYFSYLFSGRIADANLYLKSIPRDKKNKTLTSIEMPGVSNIYIGSFVARYDAALFESNNLYYEAVKSGLSINAGFESYFLHRFKGTFAYTKYLKRGKEYSASIPSGADLDFTQNQVYAKLTGYVFPGWEFSGIVHAAFYKDINTDSPINTEYLGGAGISKNGWKIRTGVNFSVSNFSNSSQVRSEGYVIYLPSGNLNLYLTSGGMYQSDKNWGGTYQINKEIGLKVLNFLWIESGIVEGNSFLYARNQGLWMNNSFQIPATTIYSNIIILPGQHIRITITPFYSENRNYSWDLTSFTRTDKLSHNSFGGSIKLEYKNK